jgi:hypothetical protein
LNEHEHEPIPGLPAELPEGESLLWQGAPAWRALARRAFHVWQVAAYFVILLGWSAWHAADTGELAGLPRTALVLAVLAVAAMAVLMVIAWLTQRTTVYTITSRRVVIRFGIALPMTINLPFRQVVGAGLRLHADGTGDLPIALTEKAKIAFPILWPHVRPWRLVRPEPMLRCVPEAAQVGQILARALAAANDQPAQAAASDTSSRAAAGTSPRAPVAA